MKYNNLVFGLVLGFIGSQLYMRGDHLLLVAVAVLVCIWVFDLSGRGKA